jgi:hypothetical protein
MHLTFAIAIQRCRGQIGQERPGHRPGVPLMSAARQDAPMAHFVGQLRQWVVDFRPEAPNELIEMRRLGDFDRHVGAHLTTIDVHIA